MQPSLVSRCATLKRKSLLFRIKSFLQDFQPCMYCSDDPRFVIKNMRIKTPTSIFGRGVSMQAFV